ncbi:MAG: phosphotransferase [Solirubrobacteraceae bacterium]
MSRSAPTLDLDPRWLTDKLVAGGYPEAAVIDVEAEPLPLAGVFCDLARLRLSYDKWVGDPGPTHPATVIAKVPREDEQTRAIGTALGLYERERRFYAELAMLIPIRIPRCYHPGDGARGHEPLLIEDLGGLRFGDQLAGAAACDAAAVIDSLAQLHAAFWNGPELQQMPWLSSLDDETFTSTLIGLVAHGATVLDERFRGRVADSTLDRALNAAGRFREVVNACRGGPPTITHYDTRFDNVCFDPSGAPVLFDWQAVARSRGTHDLAYMISCSMEPSEQDSHWEALLRRYHAALVEHGVEDYSWEQCLQHYREDVAFALVPALSMLASVGTGDDRAEQLAEVSVTRMLNHTTAINAFEAVR